MLKSIPNNSKNNLKLNLEIIPNDNNLDEVISNALMTQLMVTIAQIGIRVDKIDEIYCSTIKKENVDVKEESG